MRVTLERSYRPACIFWILQLSKNFKYELKKIFENYQEIYHYQLLFINIFEIIYKWI